MKKKGEEKIIIYLKWVYNFKILKFVLVFLLFTERRRKNTKEDDALIPIINIPKSYEDDYPRTTYLIVIPRNII